MGLVLAGGMMGFALAVVGYLGFGLPLVAALALWALSGPAGALLAILALPPRAEGAEATAPRHPALPQPA